MASSGWFPGLPNMDSAKTSALHNNNTLGTWPVAHGSIDSQQFFILPRDFLLTANIPLALINSMYLHGSCDRMKKNGALNDQLKGSLQSWGACCAPNWLFRSAGWPQIVSWAPMSQSCWALSWIGHVHSSINKNYPITGILWDYETTCRFAMDHHPWIPRGFL